MTDTPELQRLKRTQEQISNVGDCLFGDAPALTRVSRLGKWDWDLEVFSVLPCASSAQHTPRARCVQLLGPFPLVSPQSPRA